MLLSALPGLVAGLFGIGCSSSFDEAVRGDESAITSRGASAIVGIYVNERQCTFSVHAAVPAGEALELRYSYACGDTSIADRRVVSAPGGRQFLDRNGACTFVAVIGDDGAAVTACAEGTEPTEVFRRVSTPGASAMPGRTCRALACSAVDAATCTAVPGCERVDRCDGRPWSCADVPLHLCFAAPGCYLADGSCQGLATACPQGSSASCTGIPGCSLERACSGRSTASCAGAGERECTQRRGCALD